MRDDLGHSVDHAVDAAAALHVNKGKAIGDEIVAHVHDIGVGKENDRVAVSMPSGEIQSTDVFAVQVNGDVVIEGDDGQRLVGRGFHVHVNGTAVASPTAAFQAFANVFLRNNRSLFLEVGIPAGMIGVIVRVDDKPHRLVGDTFQRSLNLVG